MRVGPRSCDRSNLKIWLSQLARVGSLMRLWWGHLLNSFSMVLKDAILVTGKEDVRCEERQAEGKDKENEKWGTKDMASRFVVQHHRSTHSSFTLSDDFMDNFNTTLLNSAIDSLWTHTQPWGSTPLPHLSQGHWIKSSFPFIYPNFPMMSHLCFVLLLFFFWLSFWFVMLFWKKERIFPLTHWNENHLLISWNVA